MNLQNQTKRRLIFCLLIIIVIIAIILIILLINKTTFTGKAIEEKDTIKIGYLPITHSLPFYVALDKGYFKDEGLNVKAIKFSTTGEVIVALISGKIDATAAIGLPELFLIEENSPGQFKVYVITINSLNNDQYGDFILVKKDSDIKKISELKGKKIGVFPSPTIQILTNIILEKNGIKEVSLIPIAPPLQLESLATGQIDALVALEPTATIALENNIARVLVRGPIETYVQDLNPGGAFVFSAKFLEKNPEESHKIKKAIYKAIDFTRKNSLEARKTLPNYTSIPEKIALKTFTSGTWKIYEIDKESLKEFRDILYEKEILTKKIDIDNMLLK